MMGVDGKYHSILAQGVPIRDEAGRIQRWAGINLDISRLKNTERALLEADRRKDEFLATLAHELRNPLAPIRNAVRILDSDAADDRQRKWGREVIARQVQRMSLLLDDLLDVSRITRGQLELKKDYVDLKSVVGIAVETARPLLDAKQHQLTVNLPAENREARSRSAAPVAGDRQPAHQRGQVHRPGRQDRAARAHRKRRAGDLASATTASASRPNRCPACSPCSRR